MSAPSIPRGAIHAPSAAHVIRTIAWRELVLGFRRKFVRLLFLLSLLPPLVVAIILITRLVVKQAMGVDLEWDPVLAMLRFQALPVVLLALGLGTPGVARDRSEDVLYLYAVRPVSPWHYMAGKMLAVAVPALACLLLPGFLIALVRQGIMGGLIDPLDTLRIVGKTAVAALFMAIGFAGASVGPSAATKRGRWALLLALALLTLPDGLMRILQGPGAFGIGPASATTDLLEALFQDETFLAGLRGAAILTAWGLFGALLTRWRVSQEMIP